ncbi:MAG: DUF1893 domain-containing protein, partial [Lachnoclostridium sp.]|nr:DUF1893 domain-containing protein [Lachnoclostridium sp.]
MTFLKKAKNVFEQEEATCVIVNEKDTVISFERGILPVLKQFNEVNNPLTGASVADRVIGKSAAFLFVYGKAKEVYGEIISDHAIDVLNKYHIPFTYKKRVPSIINRKGDGMCPMEMSVLDIDNPKEAYDVLCKKVAAMKNQEN